VHFGFKSADVSKFYHFLAKMLNSAKVGARGRGRKLAKITSNHEQAQSFLILSSFFFFWCF
jgi:hypothetical protein